jgi:phosphoglycerate dehydrogenase-like enzyme
MLRGVTLAAVVGKDFMKTAALLQQPPFTSVFGRVVVGETVSDFAAEFTRPEPVVLFMHGRQSVQVFQGFHERDPDRITWAHSQFAGLDWFNFGAFAAEVRCPVTNARGVYSEMLAEHVLLGVLYFNRQVAKLHQLRRDRVWNRFASRPSSQQTVAIIGYGDIGRCCAQRLKGGLAVKDIVGYRRTALPGGASRDDLGVRVVSESEPNALRGVLEGADIIIAVLPKTAGTTNLFNEEAFGWIKAAGRKPIFINIGRGSTVDESALHRALTESTLGGAALDVFAVEPLPKESPLWQLDDDKVLITSHNADISNTMEEDSVVQFAELVAKYDVDKSLPSVLVDLKRGY